MVKTKAPEKELGMQWSELTLNEIDKIRVALNLAINQYHDEGRNSENSINVKTWYEINDKLIKEEEFIRAIDGV